VSKKVIIVAGPTCSGKTSLSLLLARQLGTEIISADSRQVYRHLDIGTAKPDKSILGEIKHHLIDFLEITDVYDASRFENDALGIIHRLHSEGKIPIVAGGTGLYLRALVDGIFDVPSDDDIRVELFDLLHEKGKEFLFDELQKVDPVSAGSMLPQNWKRVMRALEVFKMTGKPIHELQKAYRRETDIEFLQYQLDWPREILYSMIDARVDFMIEQGLEAEVRSLAEKGFTTNINALNTVGYKEMFEYIAGGISFDEMIRLIKRNTRHYAKRQLTWFRKDERINKLSLSKSEDMAGIADTIITIVKSN
jgi:tRNA dimethylallyltransferase